MIRQALAAQRLLHLRKTLRDVRCYASESTPPSRLARLESRLPRFLQRVVTPLRHAPVSHITAFILLHEVTAIIPLFGLAAYFHYTHWLPPYISETAWVHYGTEKFGKYLRKRGWIAEQSTTDKWMGRGEGGVRVVVELATAYAVTKALLPLRLVVSVWGTPWFARWTVLPVTNTITRFWRRKGATKAAASPAAGTGATGAGVLPKKVKGPVK